MAKYSVKKPYTVFVVVIAIVVLGFISYNNMTPDLFPTIELPYVALITSYPGASPEKIEETVTKPIEQSMASLENIKTVSSVTDENISMVLLEFGQDANIEAITVDILQNISRLQGYWDEMVSTPIIMKMNPDMLPIMVAAVEMDDMEVLELSDLVEQEIKPRLEGITGVASLELTGVAERQVNVVISQDKINSANAKIAAAIHKKFNEMETELKDSRGELEDGLSQLESGIREMEAGVSKLQGANTEFEKKEKELAEGKLEVSRQLEQLRLAQIALAAEELKLSPLYIAVTKAEETLALADTEELIAAAEKALQLIDEALSKMDPPMDREMVKAAWQELSSAKAELESGVEALEKILEQLEQGEIQLQDAKSQMEAMQLTAQLQLSLNMPKLVVGQSQMESALTQIDGGMEELDSAREKAIEGANINNMLDMDMISNILRAQNFSMPAGYVYQSGVDYLVRVGDEIGSLEELDNLLLFDPNLEGVSPIRLNQVADVFISDNLESLYGRINNNAGVLLSFNKQSNYATAEVSQNIKAKFDELSEDYEGLRFTSLMDQGDYIFIVIDSIVNNLLYGAVFAIIILFLFLRDIKPTLITLFSIPISVLFALVLMYFSGVTLNIISMSGLAVSVGMLVDNSIVVIENIYRYKSLGESAESAAIKGAKQVAAAITSSTLTTVCVFAPIVFVEGLTRQLFTDIALTMAYSLLASLIVAMTVVPAMAGKLFKNMEEKPSKTMGFVLRSYERILSFTLRFKAPTLLLSLALLVLSAWLLISQGFVFMPEADMPQIEFSYEIPEDGSFEDLKNNSNEIIDRVLTIDGVDTVGAIANNTSMLSIMGGGTSSNDSEATGTSFYVMIKEGYSGNAVSVEIEKLLADIEGETIISSSGNMLTALSGSGVGVNVFGADSDDMLASSRMIAETIASIEGISSVDDGIGETKPEIRFVVDKDKAMAKGLTVAQVYSEVANSLKESVSSSSLSWDGKSYSMTISQKEESLLTPAHVAALEISVQNAEGEEEKVAISSIAKTVEAESQATLRRSEQRRYISVTTELEDGYNVSLVAREIEKELLKLKLPVGVSYEFTGENESIQNTFDDLINMLLLGMLLVYLIMVAQFQSLKSPFIVMFTIPLAFTGGFFALLITGFKLSAVALIGFAMLVGIIVNNGIVLVDYINQLREEGVSKREALIQAGSTRLRPILMTSLTTVLGLITMAIGVGTGSELMQPVAIVCIGGLLYATLMTLFVVPIIYDIFHRAKKAELSSN
ncbi:efflux RND transporter permease subunit [Clostridiaceae bacterium OttesenSCG-928-D20]|nr:efflux RND transporter permease subunit [Clostridiaceae bacterium OttesenSCG-928-D20]